MLSQALPAGNSLSKKDFSKGEKRRRISSCLAEELEADIQNVVPEFELLTPPKTSVGHREAGISFSMKQSPSLVLSRLNSRARCEMISNRFHNHHPSAITFHIPLQTFRFLG